MRTSDSLRKCIEFDYSDFTNEWETFTFDILLERGKKWQC
jgi:hypothetical protein